VGNGRRRPRGSKGCAPEAGWRGRSRNPVVSDERRCSRTSSSALASYSISVFVVRNGDTSAVSRGGGSGFTGIFEIVATDEAGGGRLKKETHLRGHIDCRPFHPLGPLLPDRPLHPYLPDGRRGQETAMNAPPGPRATSSRRPNAAHCRSRRGGNSRWCGALTDRGHRAGQG
jgi:hypothetical protein